jgi:hypothetical protein
MSTMIFETLSMIRGHWLPMTLLLACATAGASAQGFAAQANSGAKDATATRPQTSPAATPKPAAPPVAPGADQALYLVRSTLLTLNDANRSGNYTVLRDLAAPDFQAKNTSADLVVAFSDLRRRNFDLFSVALLSPKFTTPPALDGNNRLRLAGFFPTRPLQINFDLTFQVVGGQWRLLAISVATPEATKTQSQINRPPKRGSPGPFYGFRAVSGTLGWRW